MRLAYNFDASIEGFVYHDDAFRFTSEPDYAGGWWTSAGGVGGSGALQVRLGGVDNRDIAGMSGGWSTRFTVEEPQSVSLTFSYQLSQSALYEPGEYSEALVALDGALIGMEGREYLARLNGDGQGGASLSTGWQSVTLELGVLTAGEHTLTFGGYNNLKTEMGERTVVRFDDIVIESGPGLSAFEARVLELTNAYRLEHGLDPLQSDASLNAAAEDWSREMADGDFFRHSSPDQVRDFGYAPIRWGENIAAGFQTPEAVVEGWIDSPSHRANILNPYFEEIGIGHVYLPDDGGDLNYRHYWTQTFGTDLDSLV